MELMLTKKRVPCLLPSRAKINFNLSKLQRSNMSDCKMLDRISALPDEILVNILASLSLDEAQATSILSRRWRYIWRNVLEATEILNFDAEKHLSNFASRSDLAIPYYVEWVNAVMERYRGRSIKQFRVCYDLDSTFSSSIDQWILFAMRKGVEILEFDFLEYGVSPHREYPIYVFPHKLLGIVKEAACKHICIDIPSVDPCACIGFKTLKSLNFKCVDLDGGALEYLLSNCPALEQLSIYYSSNLLSLKVAGPSIALKHLVIQGCDRLESIEICDANLVSFSYRGDRIDLHLRNLPLLVEVSICEQCHGDFLLFAFHQLSRCFSQLEILKLNDVILSSKIDIQLPMFTNLKHLELRFDEDDHCILFHLSSFIKASPHLQKLVLELYSLSERREIKFVKPAKFSHDYLRVVKIFGYHGSTSECELVKFFNETAVNLEKIDIDPAHPAERHYCFPKHRRKPDIEEVAKLEQSENDYQTLIRKIFRRD